MSQLIDTLLLTALPASGKSELRRFLALQDPVTVARDFHVGPTVQLDDYPYVHMMRRISEELTAAGSEPIFFAAPELPFREPRDWGTLIELVNEDYADLHEPPRIEVASAARWLFERFDAARRSVGAEDALGRLPRTVRQRLEDRLEAEARTLLDDKLAAIPDSLDGRTIVIEFARGGPENAPLPLPAPLGYRYSFAQLSETILDRASVLYIWVTPEESRRKNDERSRPGRDGDASILHHGVPEAVMRGDYGTDDMGWLIDQSDRPDRVLVEAHGRNWYLPVARFDNRRDLTTFLRDEPSEWPEDAVAAVSAELRRALAILAVAGRG